MARWDLPRRERLVTLFVRLETVRPAARMVREVPLASMPPAMMNDGIAWLAMDTPPARNATRWSMSTSPVSAKRSAVSPRAFISRWTVGSGLLGIVVAGSMMAPTELAPPWATAIARTATAQNAVPQLAPDPAFQPAVQPAGECRHYRLVQKTVYDDRPVTVYRLENETTFVERTVTVNKPVWQEELRERRYQVARPVIETNEREERHVTRRPVWETEYREESYDRVTYVDETQTRQERYMVQRPVWEERIHEQQQVVRRAVTDTVMQEQQVTAYEQQTTLATQYVDQGGYVNSYVFRPGATQTRLRWLAGAYYPEPTTGQPVWHRGGLHWVPTQAPGTYQVQQQYVPNVVAQQVPVTQIVARPITQQVPVQVMRYQDEVVTQRIPQKVLRMENQEEIREVPFTVRRPVTERIVTKIPVQVCKWIETEEVRKVPVRTERIEYEDRVEPYRIKVLKYQTESQVLREPRTTQKWVAYESVQRVPRSVYYRVPIDAQGNDLVPSLPTPPPTVTRKVAPSDASRSGAARSDAARSEAASQAAPKPTASAAREVAPATAEQPLDETMNVPAASDSAAGAAAGQRPALGANGASPPDNSGTAPRTLEPPAAAPPAAVTPPAAVNPPAAVTPPATSSPTDSKPATSGSGPLDFVPKATGRLNTGPAAIYRGGLRIPTRNRS